MLFRLLIAFLSGGAICLLTQIVIDKTALTPARILTSLVVLGVILGGLGCYEPFLKLVGAGASVPLTGFGNLMARGVREAIDREGALGIITGGFRAGAGGLSVAVFTSLLAGLFTKSNM